MQTESSFQRRKDQRYSVSLNATIHTKTDGELDRTHCKIVNLSRHGMRLEVVKTLEQDHHPVEIHLILADSKKITATFSPLYINRLEQSSFICGGTSTFSTESARRRMHAYLNTVGKEKSWTAEPGKDGDR